MVKSQSRCLGPGSGYHCDVGLPAAVFFHNGCSVWVLQIQSKHFQTFFGNYVLPLFKVFLIVSHPFSPFTPFKTASMFFCLLFPLAFVPHCIPPVFLLVVFSRSKSVLNKQFHLSRRVALLIPTLPTQTGHWWWSLFAANPVDLYLNGSVERVSIPHSLGFSCGTRTGRCQLCDHFISIISTPGTWKKKLSF